MIYEFNLSAVAVFAVIVIFTLGLSTYLGRRAKSASGYFAAGGGIHWFVNGVAFAGDYLSAASFLGICGMIAFYGYDGFLYSIGYLAGWVVALLVIAEPLKRMGKYTFADALNYRFNSRGIKLAAAVSTLVVSLFYLIPQMVGAGALVKPLLGLPYWAGVVMVGAVVIFIVVSAGMVSTTYVQFLKGGLLVAFSLVLTGLILNRGFQVTPQVAAAPQEAWRLDQRQMDAWRDSGAMQLPAVGPWEKKPYFIRIQLPDQERIITYRVDASTQPPQFWRCQTLTKMPDGKRLVDGLPLGKNPGQATLQPVGTVLRLPENSNSPTATQAAPASAAEPGLAHAGPLATGPLGPVEFLRTLQQSEVLTWDSEVVKDGASSETTVYYPKPTLGSSILQPGNLPSFRGIRGGKFRERLDFVSLMLALFGGTASLPHILIRYYTVKDQAAARKSTIVGIGTIGLFYVLTLYMGLGAMTSGSLDVSNSNLAAPLMARSFGDWLFAVISAIAFTTVLGTVSGLIIAASGAVVHDLLATCLTQEMNDHSKVRVAKIASVVVGILAIALGILFETMNVTFLVGWAFSIAASANLPALVMLLFWKGTSRQGVIASILVGMTSSLAWILLSADAFKSVYGMSAEDAVVPFAQPGIVTIPLAFLTLVVVSLFTAAEGPVETGAAATAR